jgi:peptidoglycan/xylan/chitin deacetylase (PgdA/CDA1 family)
MYHYVRPIEGSRYPQIKGLEASAFLEQIRYLEKWYENVTAGQVIEAAHGGKPLPRNAVLLTFDDGYLDHFQTVFPVLQNHGMHGCFFPPSRCIERRALLDVNKIHYILAATQDASEIVRVMEGLLERFAVQYEIDSIDAYRQQHALEDRFDSREVVYVKRMLQKALPKDLRHRIVDELFRTFVDVGEECLANELYMTSEQLRCMVSAGMTVGSHGHDHYWLNQLSEAEQAREIDESLRFLRTLGASDRNWVMCYPYGAWDDKLLGLLRRRGCAMGLTTEVALAQVPGDDVLLLPRLDTNDLPKSRETDPNVWFQRALGTP